MSGAVDSAELETLLSGIKAIVQRAADERDRWGHIAATIRVNALHHGATTEEAEAMVRGETNFVSWVIDRVEPTRATTDAAIRAAALEEAARVLDDEAFMIEDRERDYRSYGGTDPRGQQAAQFNLSTARILRGKAAAIRALITPKEEPK